MMMQHSSVVDVAHAKTGTTLVKAFTVSFCWQLRPFDEVSSFPPTLVSIVTSMAAKRIAEKEVREQLKTNEEVEEQIRENPWIIRTISSSDKSIKETEAVGLREVDLEDFFKKDPAFKESA